MQDTAPKMNDLDPVSALQFLVDIGVDEVLEAESVDRFALAEQLRVKRQQAQAQAKTQPQSQSRTQVAARQDRSGVAPMGGVQQALEERESAGAKAAEHIAREAKNLDGLMQAVRAFDGCALKATCANTVYQDGNPQASIMFVGESPGVEEDRQGKPFLGPSGQLLDKMLASIGLSRDTVYITNLVPWRPPGNRAPNETEIATVLPFMKRHIEFIDPAVVVPLGGVSSKALLQRIDGITRLRGEWSEIKTFDQTYKALPMLHPAYLLRAPAAKRDAWKDWLSLKRLLDSGLRASTLRESGV